MLSDTTHSNYLKQLNKVKLQNVSIYLLYCTRKLKSDIMPLGTIIGGITSMAGSYSAYKGQQSANKTNIRLAQEGREHDVNMWNRQNAYNTPEMQMQRLKEAGLNPNLIYGSGQASTGNADAPKPAHVATTSNALASFNNNNAIQMLSAYQDWQIKKAQIRNINAETKAKEFGNEYQGYLRPNYSILADQERRQKIYDADIAHARSLGTYQDWMTNQLQYSLDKKYGAFEARSKLAASRLNESQQRIELLRKQITQRQLQNELDEQLKPYGMSTGDELWQRMLAPIVKQKFGGFMNFMNDPKQHFKDTFYKNKNK